MAEKGFGVKEINLIGASGTPTIESPNNLNLNAVNVAISTNVSIGGTLTVSGNISVGGTLTYEDVTNIDSVGIVTAREGVFIPDSKELKIGNTAGSADLKIFHDGSDSSIANTTGVFFIQNTGDLRIRVDNTDAAVHCVRDGAVELYHAGTKKFETTSTGVSVTGTVAATSFSGSGASLTGIAVTEAPVVDYTISANGSSAYRFHGGGVDETANNPDLYLIRGQKYRFNNTTGSGHPFAIREANGGSAYTNGVTGNNQGIQFFTVPYDAPAKIFYQCTIHGGMVGNIYIRGAGGQNTNVGITTFSGLIDVNQLKKTSGTLDYLAATHTFNNAAGTAEYLRINSDGNLMLRKSTVNYLVLGSNGDSGFGATISNNMNWIRGNQDNLQMNTASGGFMGFEIGGSEKFKIASSGQFGIGGSNYGTAGQVIRSTGNSSAPVWANPGRAIQYLTDYKTSEQNTGSSSWQTISGLAKTITPKNANSRFLLLFMATGQTNGGRISLDIAYSATGITDDRIGNALGEFALMSSEQTSGQNIPLHMHWVHHPNTTNAVTYTPQFRGSGSNTVIIGASNHPAHFTVIELEGF